MKMGVKREPQRGHESAKSWPINWEKKKGPKYYMSRRVTYARCPLTVAVTA